MTATAADLQAANAARTGMTAAEFEAGYAARSGVTVEFLHEWGMFAEPCSCDEDGCEGWAMGRQWEDAIFEDWKRGRPSAPRPRRRREHRR